MGEIHNRMMELSTTLDSTGVFEVFCAIEGAVDALESRIEKLEASEVLEARQCADCVNRKQCSDPSGNAAQCKHYYKAVFLPPTPDAPKPEADMPATGWKSIGPNKIKIQTTWAGDLIVDTAALTVTRVGDHPAGAEACGKLKGGGE